jgi:DNA-binding beta-propeller fold protein YncE
MKRVPIGICLAMVIVANASLFPGRAQEVASDHDQSAIKNWAGGNPLKIALLKWYQANTTTIFNVGKTQNSSPYGIAFDGENIWTANNGEGTVTKLRASDGEHLGTFTVGKGPIGVVFDGANIWAHERIGEYCHQAASQRWQSSGHIHRGKFAVLACL